MYPILLNLKNKKVLVIGGGRIAERKVLRLLMAGADIFLTSPSITDYLQELVDEKKLIHIKRKFIKDDLKNIFLVIAATNDEKVNHLVFSEAEKNGILVNAADDPDCCSFYVPSIIDRGDLLVAISTHGKSPAFAKLLRKKLEKYLPEELAKEVAGLGDLRERQKSKSQKEREKLAKQDAERIFDLYFKD